MPTFKQTAFSLLSTAFLSLSQMAVADCLPDTAIPAQVRAARVVSLGETHGTQQGPAFLADLLCGLTNANKALILALELPSSEQPALDAYMRSGDDAALKEYARTSVFWNKIIQDGRSSQAMLVMLKRVREMVAGGKPIAVLAFDAPWLLGFQAEVRDKFMAEVLRGALDGQPMAQMIVFAGSAHAQKGIGSGWDPQHRSAISHLAEPQTVALLMQTDGGDAWVCMSVVDGKPDCGKKPFGTVRRGASNPAPITIASPSSKPLGFDGYFYVGRISASPPANAAP